MILSFKISRDQKKALLSFYPGGIKQFVEKTISDTADKIIIERENFNVDKELKEYHDRKVLNDHDFHKRKCSQATKDKISKGLKATSEKQGWKGIPLLEETKILIGLKNKGKILSQATKDAISDGNKGKIRTEEWRQNISKAKTGQKYKKRVKVESN